MYDANIGADKEKKAGAVNLGAGDIERLRKAVQSLVQHTGPLGSCMDYVQEDVSIMASELHRWEEECRKCVESSFLYISAW